MKLYTKRYPKLPNEAVKEICEKYRFVSKSLTNSTELRVPEVVSCEENTIAFDHLTLNEDDSLRTLMCQLPYKEVERIFYVVGTRLAKLHRILQVRGYIHGDFWPANIFYNDTEVTFIDLEPTHGASKNWKTAIYGVVEDDLAHFIVLSDTLFPRYRWYRYPIVRTQWYRAFLNGYRESGGVFDEEILREFSRRKFRSNFKSILRSKRYSVRRKVGALGFRLLAWAGNPYLR